MGVITQEENYRDVFYEGDCDSGVDALCAELGDDWVEELATMSKPV